MNHQLNLPIVAAFDFDGTLTFRDTLLPFLCYSCGNAVTYAHLLLEMPCLLGFVCGLTSRQEAKEAVLTRSFSGKTIEFVLQKGREFAQAPLNRLLRPEGMMRFLWHQGQGHRCVLISANLDAYLHPWASHVGFHDVICSRMAIDSQGKATGKLIGANCWGAEKTRRLLDLVGPKENFKLYAYGDSSGDKDLLELADFSFYRKFK